MGTANSIKYMYVKWVQFRVVNFDAVLFSFLSFSLSNIKYVFKDIFIYKRPVHMS